MKEQVRPLDARNASRGRAEMGGSPRRRRTAAETAGALAFGLAAALAGCGWVTTTEEDRAYAEKPAAKHHPSVLRVIDAHTLLPRSGGSEITFAMTDDPDAVVRMRVDADAGTCDTHDCRGVMDEAVERGRRDAAALRGLLGAFRRCGHEVVAVDPQTGAPWIAASPTNATVTGLLKDIGACARQRKDGTEVKGASVSLVSPAVAGKRPTPACGSVATSGSGAWSPAPSTGRRGTSSAPRSRTGRSRVRATGLFWPQPTSAAVCGRSARSERAGDRWSCPRCDPPCQERAGR
ncbi:hypothetical protein ACFZAT_21575 [Streptomyces sp. NPDC008163]|uniref:hypothetical protein n=1 Tax=Streptomyces sp. NPDC008163 TaxID=3364818 RepID=UPI0036EE5B0A